MSYGQLGRKEEGRAAVAKLLELYPDIAHNLAREHRKYNGKDETLALVADGLRKAGLDIPPAQ
jgi:adenylate cyclase